MKVRQQRTIFLWHQLLFFAIGVVIGLLLLLTGFFLSTTERLWPLTTVAGIPVGGLRPAEAIEHITRATQNYAPTLQYREAQWSVPSAVWQFEIAQTVAQPAARRFSWPGTQIPLLVSFNETAWQQFLSETKAIVETPSAEPSITYVKNAITIQNGSDGVMLDEAAFKAAIMQSLTALSPTPITIPIQTIHGSLTAEEQTTLKQRAEKLLGKKVTIIIDEEKVVLQTKELLAFLSLTPEDSIFEQPATQHYTQALAERFNRDPQNARLQVEGGKVSVFAPGRDGITIKTQETAALLTTALTALLAGEKEATVVAELTRQNPQVATGDVNTLGLTERVGHGESYYAHSIANRIYNIGLTASRINGILIAPGEEFSFLKTVGDITAATGFKPAYVISGGRTVLGDGGGVCQVSTTLFRTAMNAGLPIVERWAHAYRVGYYEQNSKPGFDATVYYPSKDFRFRNDTSHYLLIYVLNDPKTQHLTIDLYGTPDGRVVTLSPGRLSGITPPPPDLIQDDPTLPPGVMKQVDWAAWGGKAAFDYKVERDGQVLFSRTFTSTYQPWQNVYLRGVAR